MMTRFRRQLTAVLILVSVGISVATSVTANTTRDNSSARRGAPTDWSKAIVESTMKRYPTGESWKGWGYAK
ncbi:MAG TPA: hypothetical protein VKD91_18095, partial [Pyrinomonadaceae bacterium]|nr:hypothetical protein [Pyrinomonadaceae bacterium]